MHEVPRFAHIPPDFRENFRAEEARLRANLKKTRAEFQHAGNKGARGETAFRSFLRTYLPRRYMVGHGEVIDRQGTRTGQTDVIITAADHPGTVADEEAGLALAPGVVGLGEVKSVLTTAALRASVEAASKVRKIQFPMKGTVLRGSRADADRFGSSPPYFVFAYESNATTQTIVRTIVDESRNAGSDMTQQTRTIDAVFVLDTISAVYLGDGEGSVQMRNPDGKNITGWGGVPEGYTLLYLLAWLTTVMPRVEHPRSVWSEFFFSHPDELPGS